MDEIVESPLVDYLYQKADAIGIPLSGTFELTPCCNMNCKMCYVRLSKEEMNQRGRELTTKEWIELAEKARERGMLFLLLTGGEPFLRNDFRELYEAFREMGLVISINSNGTLLNQEFVSWLSNRKPARMNITLYGASDDTYGRLCKNPKGFTQVTRALELLKEADIPVKLNCSLTPYNVEDMEKIQQFALEHEYPIQTATYMFPQIRKDILKAGQCHRFSASETAKVTARLEYLRNGKNRFEEHCQNILLGKKSNLEKKDCVVEGEEIRCRAGSSSFWITWEGKMLSCGLLPTPCYDLFEYGFSKSWEQLKRAVREIRLPMECAVCKDKDICHTCAAMVLAETGDFKIKPQYRCDMLKEYKKACELVRKKEKNL